MINPRRSIRIRKSIESIVWRRFHKIGEPLSDQTCQYVYNSEIPFPNFYKVFGSSNKCVPASVKGEDFEGEILCVTEAVRLSFKRF